MPAMIMDLGISKADLGYLGAIFYIVYGVSKFLSGVMSDRSNPRYFMSIGLILTSLCNICFGFSSSISFFMLFWGLNGWFQGWGWPPTVRLLTHWYSKSERGRWWAVWNTSHNVGGALIPVMVAVIAEHYGWRISLFFPGIICIILGLFLMNRLRDTPVSLGLPTVEEFRNDYTGQEPGSGTERLSVRAILFDQVFKNPYIWALAMAYFFVYAVRAAINDWALLYFVEEKSFTPIVASSFILAFEVGGFMGNLAAGWLSDTVFNGKRIPVNALFCLGSSCVALAMAFSPFSNYIYYVFMMALSGFFVFGPQMLIGIACAELSHKNASGAATGFAGTFAYTGAALAVYLFGRLADEQGWQVFFPILSLISLVAFLFLLPMWSLQKTSEPEVKILADSLKT